MGIDSESERAASLVIGPTSLGMVRIYVESEGIELPMDFEPGEALEIAEELRAAAERALASGGASGRSLEEKPKEGGTVREPGKGSKGGRAGKSRGRPRTGRRRG